MSSLLFVEAFGQLLRGANLEGIVSEDEEDLFSVFRARAELTGWTTMSAGRRRPLWNMNEAELTAGIDASRIGCVQVGLEESLQPDVIVLLTDGASNRGVSPVVAARAARDRGVRVYTIGFGTAEPTILKEPLNNSVFQSVRPELVEGFWPPPPKGEDSGGGNLRSAKRIGHLFRDSLGVLLNNWEETRSTDASGRAVSGPSREAGLDSAIS